MKVYGPASFLNAALQHVQSESIRAWAVTPHNKPIFIKLAKLALTSGGSSSDSVVRFAAYIVASAMG